MQRAREERRIFWELNLEISLVVLRDDDISDAQLLTSDLSKFFQLFGRECEAHLADGLFLVAFGALAPWPLAAHIVRLWEMRVELVQRS